MNERCLIINADDFGICQSADRAILELFRDKRITSTSLMGPGPRSVEAAKTAASLSLPAGVHWTLNSDWEQPRWHSVAPAEAVESLNDEKGLLHDTKLLARQAKSSQVTEELKAQVKLMLSGGCFPDHADSHCGTLYGTNGRLFFLNAFSVCRQYRLPFRMPKRHTFLEDQFRGGVPRAVRAFHSAMTGIAGMMGVDLIDDWITNPYPIREIPDYAALRDYYLRKVSSMKEGITEMFLHPAYADAEISARTPEWAKRELELRFLLSDDLFRLVSREGIRLVSWGEAPFPHKKRDKGASVLQRKRQI